MTPRQDPSAPLRRAPDTVDRHFADYRETRDPRCLARVFDLAAGELLMLAGHLAPDRTTAEDLVQDTFLAAIESADRFDGRSSVRTWLTGIMTNLARMEMRRIRRKLDPRRFVDGRLPHEDDVHHDFAVEAREFQDLLRDAIAGLPAKYREVVRLALLHGLRLREIAQATDVPRETVKTRWRRGIEMLRAALPSGIAIGAVLATVPARGLAASKAIVMARAEAEYAAFHVGAARAMVAAGKPSLAVLILGPLVLLALGAAGWSWWAGATTPTDTGQEHALAGHRPPPDEAPFRELIAGPATPSPAPDHPARLSIHVRGERPRAPADAALRPAAESSWQNERTLRLDRQGRAEVDNIEPGTWRLRTARGQERVFEIAPGEHHRVTIELEHRGVIEGVTRDKAGAPLPGAAIVYLPAGHRTDEALVVATSDASARFRIEHAPADGLLSARAAGRLAPAWFRIDARAFAAPVRLQFRGPTAALRAIVRTPDGRPAQGAAVMAGTAFDPALLGIDAQTRRAFTDDAGEALLDDIDPRRPLPVWIRAPGAACFHTVIEGLFPGRIATLRLTLATGGRLLGTVRGADGEPLGDTRVRLLAAATEPDSTALLFAGPGWALAACRSDAAGRFAFDHVPPGDAAVIADVGPDRCRWAGTVADHQERTIDLRVAAQRRLRGRVVGPDGTALAHWRVESEPGPLRPARYLHTDAEGRFVLGLADDQPIQLHFYPAQDGGLRLRHTARDVRPGPGEHTFRMPARLVPSCRVRAMITGPANDRLQRVALLGLRQEGRGRSHWRQHLDLQGDTLESRPFSPGRYHFLVQAPGLGVLDLGVHDLGSQASLDLGAHRFQQPGRVTVRVTDPDGNPSTLSAVQLVRLDSPSATRIPLVGGHGQSRELQPGRHAVTVWLPGGPPGHRIVEVQPGRQHEVELPLTTGGRPADLEVRLPAGNWPVVERWFRGTTPIAEVRETIFSAGEPVRVQRWLEPGTYRLVWRVAGEAPVEHRVEVPADGAGRPLRVQGR